MKSSPNQSTKSPFLNKMGYVWTEPYGQFLNTSVGGRVQAQLVSAPPSLRPVSSSIRSDITSLFQLISLL